MLMHFIMQRSALLPPRDNTGYIYDGFYNQYQVPVEYVAAIYQIPYVYPLSQFHTW